ncbi:MAG: ComF family protein [Rhizobiales bacterium]|nr:ComF family protein [Hyphomicrobiales bacterium]
MRLGWNSGTDAGAVTAPEGPSGLASGADRGALRLVRRLFASALDLLVPPTCLACRAPLAVPGRVCGGCWSRIDFITAPRCDRLGIPLPFDVGPSAVSAAALAAPPIYDRARIVAAYDGVMRDMVHAFKYGDRHDATDLFAGWLVRAAGDVIEPGDLVVPVPLDRWRLMERRYNQAALLAAALARATRCQYAPTLLERTRRTTSQVGLSASERVRNVAGAFRVARAWRAGLAGRRVLLVDDVVTTGATLDACARVLRRGGAASINVAALARVLDPTRPPV